MTGQHRNGNRYAEVIDLTCSQHQWEAHCCTRCILLDCIRASGNNAQIGYDAAYVDKGCLLAIERQAAKRAPDAQACKRDRIPPGALP